MAISVNKNLGNIFKNFSNGVALKEKVGLGQNNSHGCTKERFWIQKVLAWENYLLGRWTKTINPNGHIINEAEML